MKDIDGRKIIVQNPQSGKEREAIFIGEEKGLKEQDRVFNLFYASARNMINKSG